MTPTLRAELDHIEEFLMGPEGSKLAAVLAALRGPDEVAVSETDNWHLKDETTVHIRSAAFPRLAGTSGNGYARTGWVMWTNRSFNPLARSKSPHFTGHIEDAARALDLMS